jgi:ribosome-interacting GTPase 1
MLEIELEAVGIRLNSKKPDVVFRQKSAGGITVCPVVPIWIAADPQVTVTVKLTHTNERTIRSILQTYRSKLLGQISFAAADDAVHNCDVMIREDVCICALRNVSDELTR